MEYKGKMLYNSAHGVASKARIRVVEGEGEGEEEEEEEERGCACCHEKMGFEQSKKRRRVYNGERIKLELPFPTLNPNNRATEERERPAWQGIMGSDYPNTTTTTGFYQNPPSIPPPPIPPPSIPSHSIPPLSIPPRSIPPPSVLPQSIPTPSILPRSIAPPSILPRSIPPLSVLPLSIPLPSMLPRSVPPPSISPQSMLPPSTPPQSAYDFSFFWDAVSGSNRAIPQGQYAALLPESLGQTTVNPSLVVEPKPVIGEEETLLPPKQPDPTHEIAASLSPNNSEEEEISTTSAEELVPPEHSGSSVDDNFPDETDVPKSVNSFPVENAADLCLTLNPAVEGDQGGLACHQTSLVYLPEAKKNRLSHIRASMRLSTTHETLDCLLEEPSSDMKEEKLKRKKHRPKVRRDPNLDLKARKKRENREKEEQLKPDEIDEIVENQALASEVTEIDKLHYHQHPSPTNDCQTLSVGNEFEPDGLSLDLQLSIRVGSESSSQGSVGGVGVVKEPPRYSISANLGFLFDQQLPPMWKQSEDLNWRDSELETCRWNRSLELVPYENEWQISAEQNNPYARFGYDWENRLNGCRQALNLDIPFTANSCKELVLFPLHNELMLCKQPSSIPHRDTSMNNCLFLMDAAISSQSKKKSNSGRKKLMPASDGLQLVPYNNRKEVIPYMGARRGVKKYRARVPIDQETNRVWLLLENGGLLEKETDEAKAKLWTEERDRLRSRVDSFLTTMHQFQGNRRFSKWKGSVVDSVVGAFLTQNVSDHLSSSAFMCLASKFPAVSKEGVCDAQKQEMDGESRILISDDNQCAITESTVVDSPFNEKVDAVWTFPERDLMNMAYPFDNDCFNGSPAEAESDPNHVYTSFRSSSSYAGNKVRRRLDFRQAIASSEKYDAASISTEVESRKNIGPINSNCSENGANNLSYLEKRVRFETSIIENCCPVVDRVDSTLQLIQKQSASANLPPSGNMDSALEVIQEEAASALLSSKGRKKKDNSVSKISGLERARIEVSQGGRKSGSKRTKRDWEALRRSVLGVFDDGQINSERGPNEQDTINWEAILKADVAEVADTIRERGMHFILAGRIKAFLATIKKEHGSLDLEWVRKISMEDAKEFLGDVRGLGVKSGECIRLLTLEHLAFPVDTNVGRICVRLGWVPIEPLPEELQLHLLEMYPVQESIQKYIWPRLCELDQRTLYELHYQLITFGKVFCTKSKPNCNACPMRTECRHFASAYASAKPLLKGPTDADNSQTTVFPALPAPEIDSEKAPFITDIQQIHSSTHQQSHFYEPIVEFPPSPEHEYINDEDIEDFYYAYKYENVNEEFDFQSRPLAYEISEYGLSEMETNSDACNGMFSQSLYHTFNRSLSKHDSFLVDLAPGNPIGLTPKIASKQSQICEPTPIPDKPILQNEIYPSDFAVEVSSTESQCIVSELASTAIVPLSLENAFIPVPKLKNVQRLRTVHYVYEIPDDHYLLRKMEKREKDDPCYYLLAIWSPDEVPQSQEEIDEYCKDNSSACPAKDMTRSDECVKGTLLIGSRTAMRGSFPLNGTYFQVNEVFADHTSSVTPLEVPRSWLWPLQRRFVYFGTSVTTIFRGLTLEETRRCFWQGYVCVRGFERETRAPKPLVARLHFPISKQPKPTKTSISKVAT